MDFAQEFTALFVVSFLCLMSLRLVLHERLVYNVVLIFRTFSNKQMFSSFKPSGVSSVATGGQIESNLNLMTAFVSN